MKLKKYSQLTRWERRQMAWRLIAWAWYALINLMAILSMNMTY